MSFAKNTELKSRIGETGVHFRYYKPGDYKKLTKEQHDELHTWRATPEGQTTIASGRKGGRKKKPKTGKPKQKGRGHEKAIASAVHKHFKSIEEQKEKDEAENLIMSVLEQAFTKSEQATPKAADAKALALALALKVILGKAKNS